MITPSCNSYIYLKLFTFIIKISKNFSSDNQLRLFWRAVYLNKNKFTSGNILLTGATGFVGAFILYKLLQTQVLLIT